MSVPKVLKRNLRVGYRHGSQCTRHDGAESARFCLANGGGFCVIDGESGIVVLAGPYSNSRTAERALKGWRQR